MTTVIIIINYNSSRETSKCLESIYNNLDEEYEIICLDNGSTDKNERLIFQELKKSNNSRITKFYTTKKNLGFAGGINYCLSYIRQKINSSNFYVWILNNDATIEQNTLRYLKEEFNEKVSLVGSLVLNPDGTIQDIHGYLNKHLGKVSTVRRFKKIKKHSKRTIIYPIGASLLTTNYRLLKLGDFNENYFLYFEELDFVLKGIKLNYFPVISYKSKIYHKQGASTGNKDDYFKKNLSTEQYKLSGLVRLYKTHFPTMVYAAKLGLTLKLIKAILKFNMPLVRCILKTIKS